MYDFEESIRTSPLQVYRYIAIKSSDVLGRKHGTLTALAIYSLRVCWHPPNQYQRTLASTTLLGRALLSAPGKPALPNVSFLHSVFRMDERTQFSSMQKGDRHGLIEPTLKGDFWISLKEQRTRTMHRTYVQEVVYP